MKNKDDHVLIQPDVEEIKSKAFFGNKQLTKIEIPANSRLKKVCYDAFCFSSIENIILPNSIKTLSSGSFSYCQNLKSVVISEKAENVTIQNYAFLNSSIESITFPSGLVNFENNWCNATPKLTKIIIPKSNKQLIYTDNGLLLGKSDVNSYNYDIILFANRNIKNAIIPNNIT